MVAAFPSVKYISFVGMSLGGLYCRFALTSILTGSDGHPPLALEPLNLVTLATPHVGVRHHLPWHYELAVKAGLAGASGTVHACVCVRRQRARPLTRVLRACLRSGGCLCQGGN